ncbi:diaminobutyrate--2-oxoglutarate transaminase [Rhodococcus sp. IEGM 1330]|uniref:diaminobutyrate--2-oxoglutarate transaminase n=1 Tax=Rhodococcus sp. IEGM 1330 TaxID=3082225 RepID=UPI002953EE0F|nr:diaminobutyrate--2-oxoglutarate transaminase [Rhodococcus sp. IEGM 1330]MDV8022649.1 diaminobutyrate--2-oxoglutarate transaminase [Rhodococcus sp. IEGM 1330]
MSAPEIYEQIESDVRTYCRQFPVEFRAARGSSLTDVDGRRYLDLMSAAGSLNYGHNHPIIKAAVIDYLAGDGPVQSLDLHTEAKTEFIRTFRDTVFAPRNIDYKIQFAGPTGSNCVEAALKIARVATGRSTVAAFTGGFHGGSLGALAVSSNRKKRSAAGVTLPGAVFLPYDGALDSLSESLGYVEMVATESATGVDKPAAFILETIQGEGGVATASTAWLRGVADIAARHDILLIVDDIQAGCGRTGSFFSFEDAGIEPDIVCLAKSVGGLGLPMALVLLKRPLDVLPRGSHAGTFRGQNLSFVAGTAALGLWSDREFLNGIDNVVTGLETFSAEVGHIPGATPRGRGALRGVHFSNGAVAGQIVQRAFEAGILLETSGADSDVVKIMPPLTTPLDELSDALNIVLSLIKETSYV